MYMYVYVIVYIAYVILFTSVFTLTLFNVFVCVTYAKCIYEIKSTSTYRSIKFSPM